MANYNDLKTAIQQVIRTNGNEEITGALLQQSLLSMIDSLGVGYQFMGIATPATNPGTPDQKIFFIANEPGNYVNFGGVVEVGQLVIFSYDGETWNAAKMKMPPITNDEQEDALYVVDRMLNIVAKIDKDGLKDINIRPDYKKAFHICDKNGNVIFSANRNGVSYINQNWYTNKVFFTLGDSLCEANKWQTILVEKGMIFDAKKNIDGVLPISVGGTTTWGDVNTSGFARARNLVSYAENNDCDIIFVENINDLNNIHLKGSISDLEYIEYADGTNNGNPKTLYGAYKGLLNYLIKNIPTAKIFWLIPTRFDVNWDNPTYNDMYDYYLNDVYQELIKVQSDVAKLYGIKVLNLQNNAGISLMNGRSFYYNNNVHPKDIGYELWGKTIINLI